MNNAYVGIGITIIVDEDAGGLRIESVTADSPAYKAGLQVGDIILEAEGQKTIELGTTGTRDIVRGEEGTSVHLKVQREDETFECDVRESIKVDVATCRMLDNDIGCVKINNLRYALLRGDERVSTNCYRRARRHFYLTCASTAADIKTRW